MSVVLRLFSVLLLVCSAVTHHAYAQDYVRVATYNIKFLDTNFSGNESGRLQKLKNVIDDLEADIIGLQEIDDRDALEKLFPKSDWHIVIDDDSGNAQDLAVVVRDSFKVLNFSSSPYDADDQHFLFPGNSYRSPFPNRRDVLRVDLETPETGELITILVNHTKARSGGRNTTEPRRVLAHQLLVQALEQEIDEANIIYVCDCNDSPDDRSANVLETGNPDAPAAMEENQGPFMINLTESLYAQGHVSFGLKSNDINRLTDRVETIDPNSRDRNFRLLGTDEYTGDSLFDQIYISPSLMAHYEPDSVAIHDHPDTVRGNSKNRASDHMPVFADFYFEGSDDEPEDVRTLYVASLLPDPDGQDAGNETISITNPTDDAVNLAGWSLQDRAANELRLSGTIEANQTKTITLQRGELPLNNSGDEIELVNELGAVVDRVLYSDMDVQKGRSIAFE